MKGIFVGVPDGMELLEVEIIQPNDEHVPRHDTSSNRTWPVGLAGRVQPVY